MNDPTQEQIDREKTRRFTLFTVSNANRAMVFLTVLILLVIVSILGYGLIYKKQTFLQVLVDIINNNPKILSGVTIIIILYEGMGIVVSIFLRMFLEDRKRKIEEIKNEIERKRDEEFVKICSDITEWDRSRKGAEVRGEEFTEPIPVPRKYLPDQTESNLEA